jgi:polyhydroxyalkanoate synthesis repressor PhaR
MHKIKKYANRKMYDVTDKKWVTMENIADLVQSGEDICIVDNTSGKDITQEIVSQLLGRMFDDQAQNLPLSVLMKLLRKGSGGIVGFTRKYLSLRQNALNYAEGKLNRLGAFIGSDEPGDSGKDENSQDEGLEDDKDEHLELLTMLDQHIDQRMQELWLDRDAAFQRQFKQLNTEVAKLTARIETFENIFSQVLQPVGGSTSKSKRKPARSRKTAT